MNGHSKLYSLRMDAVHAMANRLLARDTLPEAARELEGEGYDRKVLNDFLLPDGSLKKIPAQQKKLLVVLRHLLKEFEPDRTYPEKAVNAILARVHPDTASLRRAMVEYKLMQRAGGKDWRVGGRKTPPGPPCHGQRGRGVFLSEKGRGGGQKVQNGKETQTN